MNALAHEISPQTAVGGLPAAAELDHALRNATPAEVIATALRTVGRDKLAVVSSFGTESAALLKVMADVDAAIPVVFLDTGWLFEETLAYRDTLTAALGLSDVRSIKPLEPTLSREDPDRELWFSDPDACCRIRKVEPLARALKPFSGWINGRKRFQGGLRAEIAVVEQDGARLKFNPIGLSLGRVYALQLQDLTRRRRARRPLARPGQDGMRHPYRQDVVELTCHSGAGAKRANPESCADHPESSPFSHGWYATTAPHWGISESCGRRPLFSQLYCWQAARRMLRSSSLRCMSTWPSRARGSIRWRRPR